MLALLLLLWFRWVENALVAPTRAIPLNLTYSHDDDSPAFVRHKCATPSHKGRAMNRSTLDAHSFSLHKRQLISENGHSCSTSMCDFPEITFGYGRAHSGRLLDAHAISLKVFTFATTDGREPHALDEDTTTNTAILQKAFNPLGIAFNVDRVTIADSIKWGKFLVIRTGAGSRFDKCRNVPSTTCREECKFEEFGWDSGKCLCPDQSSCTSSGSCVCLQAVNLPGGQVARATDAYCKGAGLSNDACDPLCNFPKYDWDNGQCCVPGTGFCFDFQYAPGIDSKSSFIELDDLPKMIPNIQQVTRNSIALLAMPWARFEELLGVAGLPWSSANDSPPPRLLCVNTAKKCWGNHQNVQIPGKPEPISRSGTTAVHEMGHIFGLLHTFAGVEARDARSQETPSKGSICQQGCSGGGDLGIFGDFCSDTPPTPQHDLCQDPVPCAETGAKPFCSDCKGHTWGRTAFWNVMGYADDSCVIARVTESLVGGSAGFFTEQQAGRMRCHLDLYFSELIGSKRPSMIVVAPTVAAGGNVKDVAAITVSWVYPVQLGGDTASLAFEFERMPPFTTPSKTMTVAANLTGYSAENEKQLTFGDFEDTTVAPGVAFRYRVRPISKSFAPLSFSPWSLAATYTTTTGFACEGDCHGHGTCQPGGVCECVPGWNSRDAACRLPNFCPSSTTCTVNLVGNGFCDIDCLTCPGEKNECTYDEAAAQTCIDASPACTFARQGDGICQEACNRAECQEDFGDCKKCAGQCVESWLGDGHCSEICRSLPACATKEMKDCEYCNAGSNDNSVLGGERCATSLRGDGACDHQCNVMSCDFDSGDCPYCAPGCLPKMIGDGNCDPACSGLKADGTPQCGSNKLPDGGDCTFCDAANKCLTEWIGDGNCDQGCLMADSCKNDFLDCKGCSCKQSQLNNQRCDQVCNRAECNFDNGECEQSVATFPDIAIYLAAGLLSGCFCCIVIPCTCFVLFLRWRRDALNAQVAAMELQKKDAIAAGKRDQMMSARDSSTSALNSGASFGGSAQQFNSAASFAPMGAYPSQEKAIQQMQQGGLYPSQLSNGAITMPLQEAGGQYPSQQKAQAQLSQANVGPRQFVRALSQYGLAKVGLNNDPNAPKNLPGGPNANMFY